MVANEKEYEAVLRMCMELELQKADNATWMPIAERKMWLSSASCDFQVELPLRRSCHKHAISPAKVTQFTQEP